MSGGSRRTADVNRGASAEDFACAYLERNGLRLLARNFRCRRGEIDLIMQDSEYLVFVEVRYRKHDAFGSAAETVSYAKRTRIITTASYFLQRQRSETPCRFDVVAIGGSKPPHRIEWIRDAFQE